LSALFGAETGYPQFENNEIAVPLHIGRTIQTPLQTWRRIWYKSPIQTDKAYFIV